MSEQILADKFRVSRQTITRRVRLLAFCIIMERKAWCLQNLVGFDHFVRVHLGDEAVRRMVFIGTCKSDEIFMRFCIKTESGVEHAVSKCLQIVVTWIGL